MVQGRLERAAERLLEDERLRGSLTDDEFQPLLDWALATVERAAAPTTGEPDAAADQRVNAALAKIREALLTVNALAEERPVRLAEAITRVVRSRDADAALRTARRFIGPSRAADALGQES